MKILSDSSRYSRDELGPPIFGAHYEKHRVSMAIGSQALLNALWKHHRPALERAEAAGRLVVR